MEYKPMSAAFLKKRGYCCKSACLHCPYGFTLKKFGLKFGDVLSQEDMIEVKEMTGRELAEGEAKAFKLVYLKDELIGAIKVTHIQVKELFLKEEFQEQNLNKEIVESYFFY